MGSIISYQCHGLLLKRSNNIKKEQTKLCSILKCFLLSHIISSWRHSHTIDKSLPEMYFWHGKSQRVCLTCIMCRKYFKNKFYLSIWVCLYLYHTKQFSGPTDNMYWITGCFIFHSLYLILVDLFLCLYLFIQGSIK